MVMNPRNSIVYLYVYDSVFDWTGLLWPAYYNGDA